MKSIREDFQLDLNTPDTALKEILPEGVTFIHFDKYRGFLDICEEVEYFKEHPEEMLDYYFFQLIESFKLPGFTFNLRVMLDIEVAKTSKKWQDILNFFIVNYNAETYNSTDITFTSTLHNAFYVDISRDQRIPEDGVDSELFMILYQMLLIFPPDKLSFTMSSVYWRN